MAFAEFCDVDAALRAIDATGRLTVGSLPVFVAASKTPLKPPKKSRSHFASTEVSSTMSAATAASTGVTSTTNESGDTGDTEMIHEDEDDIHEDEDEDAAYASRMDRSTTMSTRGDAGRPGRRPGGLRRDLRGRRRRGRRALRVASERFGDDDDDDDDDDGFAHQRRPPRRTMRRRRRRQMGKLTVGGGDAEVIPLVDETEFPPLGR